MRASPVPYNLEPDSISAQRRPPGVSSRVLNRRPLRHVRTLGPEDRRLVYKPVPSTVDFPALEREILDFWEQDPRLREARREERQRPALVVHRRPDHGQQPDGRPPRLGPDLQGPLPALLRHAGLPPAVPERLRLPGALGRGRGREGAWLQRQARDRGVRAGQVLREVQGARRAVRRRHLEAVDPARPVDALGRLVLHPHRQQHRAHLALPEGLPREGLALPGRPLDALVHPLRDRALPARAGRHRLVPRPDPHLGLHRAADRRPPRRALPGLDDHALDPPRERRARRPPGARVRQDQAGRQRSTTSRRAPPAS